VSAALDPLELRHDHALALARVVLDVSRVDPDGGGDGSNAFVIPTMA
jgi:hypothetical protein